MEVKVEARVVPAPVRPAPGLHWVARPVDGDADQGWRSSFPHSHSPASLVGSFFAPFEPFACKRGESGIVPQGFEVLEHESAGVRP